MMDAGEMNSASENQSHLDVTDGAGRKGAISHFTSDTECATCDEASSSCGVGFAIKWQAGSIAKFGRNGATLQEVLTAVQLRLMDLNAICGGDKANDKAIVSVNSAIAELDYRQAKRAEAGTLGTDNK